MTDVHPPTPTLFAVPGVRLAAVAAGIRYKDRPDLAIIACDAGTEVAGVFTRNRFRAAPVEIAVDHLAQTRPRALLINAGNANAGTGAQGHADALACCEALGEKLACPANAVLPFSTGVIGEPLAVERLIAGLADCVGALSEDGWWQAAQAIMTTDTAAKAASRQVQIDGVTVTVTGIAKGAGMIRPDMATLLGFVATDAPVQRDILQHMLAAAADASFNRITVDGDTSTNDACMLLASGRAAMAPIETAEGEAYATLAGAVAEVCQELAHAIVRDAEGATKFIAIEVSGGASEADCLEVAYTVAHSPLVKTAAFASDPNWGRILAAVGRARVAALDIARVQIYLGDVRVAAAGALDPEYREDQGQAVMDAADITIRIDLGMGEHGATVYTCDLSYDYVRINAEYRS